MNRLFQNSFYFFILIIFVAGCKSELVGVLKSDYKGDKITITGSLSLDSVALTVGKSTDAYSNVTLAEFQAQNPLVYIEDDLKTFHYDLTTKDGKLFFAGKIGLQIGKKYKVFATANNLVNVETDWITIPKAINIENLIVVKTDGSDQSPNQISFSFEDELGLDYYFYDMALKKGKQLRPVPSSVPTETENACYDTYSFNDLCFEGKKAALRYVSFSATTFPNVRGEQLADSIIVRFGKVSEQAYRAKLAGKTGDDLIDGINEPPLTYTNVKNGYGVVFAFNLKDYALAVPK